MGGTPLIGPPGLGQKPRLRGFFPTKPGFGPARSLFTPLPKVNFGSFGENPGFNKGRSSRVIRAFISTKGGFLQYNWLKSPFPLSPVFWDKGCPGQGNKGLGAITGLKGFIPLPQSVFKNFLVSGIYNKVLKNLRFQGFKLFHPKKPRRFWSFPKEYTRGFFGTNGKPRVSAHTRGKGFLTPILWAGYVGQSYLCALDIFAHFPRCVPGEKKCGPFGQR